jgi:hypothetical protein
MNKITKSTFVVTATALLLSFSVFAEAEARNGEGYRDGHRHSKWSEGHHPARPAHRVHHKRAHVKHRRAHRQAYRHGYAPRQKARYARRLGYKRPYVAVPRYAYAPAYVLRPVVRGGANIWIDGIGFSIYAGH